MLKAIGIIIGIMAAAALTFVAAYDLMGTEIDIDDPEYLAQHPPSGGDGNDQH